MSWRVLLVFDAGADSSAAPTPARPRVLNLDPTPMRRSTPAGRGQPECTRRAGGRRTHGTARISAPGRNSPVFTLLAREPQPQAASEFTVVELTLPVRFSCEAPRMEVRPRD